MMMVYHIVGILLIVGGLNWGVVGITNLMGSPFDLVEWIGYLLGLPVVADLIYVVVGLSAVVVLIMKMMKKC